MEGGLVLIWDVFIKAASKDQILKQKLSEKTQKVVPFRWL